MSNKPRTDESVDPVAALMDIVARGLHAKIAYRKGGREGTTWRTIEPRQLVDGANGLLVRALQIEPERGLRCFSVHKIVSVEEHHLPLSSRSRIGNNFCTGEVVGFSVREVEVTQEPTQISDTSTSDGTRQRLWTQPWFARYIGLLRDALLDLSIDAQEEEGIRRAQLEMRLTTPQIHAAHAYVVGEELLAASLDGAFVRAERDRVNFLMRQLARLTPDDVHPDDSGCVSLEDSAP